LSDRFVAYRMRYLYAGFTNILKRPFQYFEIHSISRVQRNLE